MDFTRAYESVVEDCRNGLCSRYDSGRRVQAESLFAAEKRLIEEVGFQKFLVEATTFAQTREQSVRLIGAGCSSMAAYLLGFSEVDPVRYRTHPQRFWTTGDDHPPSFSFVVSGPVATHRSIGDSGIRVDAMIPSERILCLLREQVPSDMRMDDATTFAAICAGDTERVFQLEDSATQDLVERIKPRRIKDLALISALRVIDCTHPEVVDEFFDRHAEHSLGKQDQQPRRDRAEQEKVVLFQESLMSKLRHESKLEWGDTYRFVLAAAKRVLNQDHPLWNRVLEGLIGTGNDCASAEVLISRLSKASSWAVCLAHHVSDAIVSYRAAFYRTHNRAEFEKAVEQVADDIEGCA